MSDSPDTPGRSEADSAISAWQDVNKTISEGAKQGPAAYLAALEKVREQIELRLIPAITKLSKQDLVQSKQIAQTKRAFDEAEKLARKYYQIVGSEGDKRKAQLKQNLDADLITIQKHWAQVLEAAKKGASEEQQIILTKQMNAQRDKAIGQRKWQDSPLRPSSGIHGELAASLLGLGELGSIAALARMVAGVSQAQFGLGNVMTRVGLGNGGTVDEKIQLGKAGGKALGGLVGLGGFTPGMTPEKVTEALSIVYTKAPQLAKEHLEPMFTRLINLGMTSTESAELVGKASAETGISIAGMVDNLRVSREITHKFGQDTLFSMQQIMSFSKAIRGTGVDTNTAKSQAQSWTLLMQDVGAKMHLGQQEISDFSSKFQGALSGMSASHAAGLLLATTGRMPTSLEAMGHQVSDPRFAKGLYHYVSKMAGAQNQAFVPEAFGQMLGMSGMNIQTSMEIQKAMQSGTMTMQQLQNQGNQSDSSNIKDARNSLAMMQGPLEMLRDLMQVLVGYWVPKLAESVHILSNPKDTLKYIGVHPIRDFELGLLAMSDQKASRTQLSRLANEQRDSVHK